MRLSDVALIKTIEITTKKLVSGPLLADARSSLKGSGFEFHQLRDYVQGDDIRYIDWKSSARSNKMLVRQYVEDRNRTIYIVVDVSASTHYGTGTKTKSDLIKQLAGTLAFVSLHRKDSVGLILFSNKVEKVIPPRNSRAHVLSLVQTLFSFQPHEKTTRLEAPFEYLSKLKSQKAIVCFISDFMSPCDKKKLSAAALVHDVMLFRCLDEREIQFPDVGTLMIEESETGKIIECDGRGLMLSDALTMWHRQQRDVFKHVDCLDLIAGKSFSGDLVKFLRTRVYG